MPWTFFNDIDKQYELIKGKSTIEELFNEQLYTKIARALRQIVAAFKRHSSFPLLSLPSASGSLERNSALASTWILGKETRQ